MPLLDLSAERKEVVAEEVAVDMEHLLHLKNHLMALPVEVAARREDYSGASEAFLEVKKEAALEARKEAAFLEALVAAFSEARKVAKATAILDTAHLQPLKSLLMVHQPMTNLPMVLTIVAKEVSLVVCLTLVPFCKRSLASKRG